jgi:predicted DNA-binding transcriptional regulator AlpA
MMLTSPTPAPAQVKEPSMEQLIDTQGIAQILGVTRKHVTDRLTKGPTFPAPVINLSRKTRRWDRAAVMAWLAVDRSGGRR